MLKYLMPHNIPILGCIQRRSQAWSAEKAPPPLAVTCSAVLGGTGLVGGFGVCWWQWIVESAGLFILPSGYPAIDDEGQRNNDNQGCRQAAEVVEDNDCGGSDYDRETQVPKGEFHRVRVVPPNDPSSAAAGAQSTLTAPKAVLPGGWLQRLVRQRVLEKRPRTEILVRRGCRS